MVIRLCLLRSLIKDVKNYTNRIWGKNSIIMNIKFDSLIVNQFMVMVINTEGQKQGYMET